MRQLLKTTKGCPISQIYLELGHIPARFHIFKMRLFFLKTILDEKSESLIQKFFQLQVEQPTKGDWASSCSNNLKQLEIYLSMNEIAEMSPGKYKNIVRRKCKEKAFEYLLSKRGSKGNKIYYSELDMSEYLSPNDVLTIEQQRYIFSLRNRMLNIPANYSANSEVKCCCGVDENMQHIFSCKQLNTSEQVLEYEKLFSGSLIEQKMIAHIFEGNMKTRNENNENSDHATLIEVPPFSVDNGNG